MAEQKPEKVNISLAPSQNASSSGASKSSSGSTTGAAQSSSASETEEARSTDAPTDDNTSKATRAGSGVAADQDQEKETETENSPSDSNPLRQRTGQETTLKPPTPTSQESGPPADEQQPGGKEATGSEETSEQDSQTATDEPDNTEGQVKETEESEETPPATIHDVDFYSSKMDTDNPSPARTSTTSSTHNGRVSTSFGVILLVFITAVIVGLVVLYQLEQAQPGSGIIFDWFS
ncbi:hypothetical protein BRC19_00245 [Candidatus Saccharibacteria bacterium QS_5_54_17]|nr:MAG: hypothetical protein BRC19_00245 [Candidatus Saccharibacteria bacterium QS_5_54_17]